MNSIIYSSHQKKCRQGSLGLTEVFYKRDATDLTKTRISGYALILDKKYRSLSNLTDIAIP